jgi:hypothetical protein
VHVGQDGADEADDRISVVVIQSGDDLLAAVTDV